MKDIIKRQELRINELRQISECEIECLKKQLGNLKLQHNDYKSEVTQSQLKLKIEVLERIKKIKNVL